MGCWRLPSMNQSRLGSDFLMRTHLALLSGKSGMFGNSTLRCCRLAVFHFLSLLGLGRTALLLRTLDRVKDEMGRIESDASFLAETSLPSLKGEEEGDVPQCRARGPANQLPCHKRNIIFAH
ncbi:uncharacterized protein [Drosophila kikkawai]|uniref:Uncharacterized protein n=1 Tax=Drosophila kikkawai TaxID=30033 RepID=A0ABM4GL30_DROKI